MPPCIPWLPAAGVSAGGGVSLTARRCRPRPPPRTPSFCRARSSWTQQHTTQSPASRAVVAATPGHCWSLSSSRWRQPAWLGQDLRNPLNLTRVHCKAPIICKALFNFPTCVCLSECFRPAKPRPPGSSDSKTPSRPHGCLRPLVFVYFGWRSL